MTSTLTLDDFRSDRHAATYVGTAEASPAAFDRLLALLNDPAARQRLIDASTNDDAALLGIVRAIESDAALDDVLGRPGSQRFKQLVGVAVRLVMEDLGWSKTGRSASVATKSRYFKKAERYAPPSSDLASVRYRERALAGLRTVATIGSAEEQRDTSDVLTTALAATRAEQGRPF